MHYVMTTELNQNIENILLELLVRAEAEAVFLCDRGGNIVSRKNTDAYTHQDNIAALAAGSFFATRELARLIGEPEFRCVFHQGDRNSIYMQNTTADHLLLVVFGKDSNPGLVKLYSNESCRILDREFQELEKSGPQGAATMHLEIDATKQPFKRAPGIGAP